MLDGGLLRHFWAGQTCLVTRYPIFQKINLLGDWGFGKDIMPSSHWQDVRLDDTVMVIDANALGLQLLELRHTPDGPTCIFFPVRVDGYWRAVIAFTKRNLLHTLDSGPRHEANRKA